MSLFSMEEVENFNIEFEFPDTSDSFIKHLIEEVPVGHLKIESLTERNDQFFNLLEILPQYEIKGNNISLIFKKNTFTLQLGGPSIPPELEDVIEIQKDQEPIFSKDFLHKLSIDVNYLLGTIISYMVIKYENVKVSGTLRFKKVQDINVNFSKIIQAEKVGSIDENLHVTGVVLKQKKDDGWSYYIRNGDGTLSITNWFNFNLVSSIDIYEIIEKYILKLNDILLNI